MILFNLRCSDGHVFEGWFRNGDAYERQVKAKAVSCPLCGTTSVEKAMMAPRIAKGRKAAGQAVEAPAEPTPETVKAAEMLRKLRELRRVVEENCDYVGTGFAEEARRIHYGESEKHGIYGESTEDEAKALADEGIEFGRVPWVPRADQ